MPVTEIQYAIPCEACFLDGEHTADTEGFAPHCRRNHWRERESSDLKGVCPLQLVRVQQLLRGNPPHCRVPHERQLAFDELCQEDSASQYALVHASVFRRRVDTARLPDAITDVKRAWVRKSTLRIPPRLQSYTCCTSTTSSAENYAHVGVFLECVLLHFNHRLTK